MIPYKVKCRRCKLIFIPTEDRSMYICPKCGYEITLRGVVSGGRGPGYDV